MVKEDLKIKILPDTEARWTRVRDSIKEEIGNQQIQMEINKRILSMAETKIHEEKRKA